jgi:flagellar biosynthesis protein FlhB
MSDDNRTHQPTPRRKKEFRDRGEIAGSRELTAAATFAAAAIALAAAGPAAWRSLHAVTAAALGGDGRAAVLVHARTAFTVAVAPILVVGAAAALLAAMAQRGWPPVVRWPGFELSRVFGFSGLAGAWSPKAALARLGGAAAKTAAIAAALALVLARHLTAVATAADADAIAATARAAVLELAAVAIAVMLAVAAFDYLRARRALGKKMMMTPDEIRREHREQDGDPAVKARRRARMRELAKRRVVAEARKRRRHPGQPDPLRGRAALPRRRRRRAAGRGQGHRRAGRPHPRGRPRRRRADHQPPAAGPRAVEARARGQGDPVGALPRRRRGAGVRLPPA